MFGWIRTAGAATALVFVASAAEAQGQSGQERGGMGGRMSPIAMVMNGITLTAEQQASIDSLQHVYEPQVMAQMQEMRAARQQGGDMQDLVQRSRDLTVRLHEDIRAILTEEQRAIFNRNVAEMEARRQQGRGGQNPR
jgi:Spy/CpxP family protein refolding chaperone